MNLDNDFNEILDYAHWINWYPDISLMKQIYKQYEDSYSILTPFAYCYLEELIRSTTSQYGRELLPDKNGKDIKRAVGNKLIDLAIKENKDNKEYIELLNKMRKYYKKSSAEDSGDNRNSVDHGYMHPRFWSKESFENLIHDIATLSKYSHF